MGELNIGVTDLDACPKCGSHASMIFQTKKDKWYVACGRAHQCGYKTKERKELLDAADEWGLKEAA